MMLCTTLLPRVSRKIARRIRRVRCVEKMFYLFGQFNTADGMTDTISERFNAQSANSGFTS